MARSTLEARRNRARRRAENRAEKRGRLTVRQRSLREEADGTGWLIDILFGLLGGFGRSRRKGIFGGRGGGFGGGGASGHW